MTIRQRLREEKRKKELGLPHRYNKAHEAYLQERFPVEEVSSETGLEETPLNSQLSSEEEV